MADDDDDDFDENDPIHERRVLLARTRVELLASGVAESALTFDQVAENDENLYKALLQLFERLLQMARALPKKKRATPKIAAAGQNLAATIKVIGTALRFQLSLCNTPRFKTGMHNLTDAPEIDSLMNRASTSFSMQPFPGLHEAFISLLEPVVAQLRAI
jgi:hypothetical protein